jgi:hypothetical protein
MSDDIRNTIDVLARKVAAKEEEATKLKKLINELCSEENIPVRYPNVVESAASFGALRADQFYGQTLTAAIRNYLEQRKASGLGAANLNEIYTAIKAGGYKFESRNEDNAKTSVGNTLRKSSSIFHRLPNGQYGLLVWYPSAKAKPEEAPPKKKPGRTKRHTTQSAALESGTAASEANLSKIQITNREIRDVILEQTSEFQGSDIQSLVEKKFPTKEIPPTKVPSVVFILKNKGLIKEVSPKVGSKPAVYIKI